MTGAATMGGHTPAGRDPLALCVGCTFGLDSPLPATAILQVAPRLQPGLVIRAERWETEAVHHSYLDHYGNRCERFRLDRGATRVVYEAQVLVQCPADVIKPNAPEVPVAALPDQVLSFVMPSRFCLPDELGHEAWQRFGDLDPGCERWAARPRADGLRDVALITSFGALSLTGFEVRADRVIP